MDEQEPEELQYRNTRRSLSEVLFSLNLFAHNKAEIEYSFLCLETVDLWLKLNANSLDYDSKKGIAYTFCLRGRRLLRASQLMLIDGYLPECEILFRSIWETLVTLAYLIEDPSESRAIKYLSFGQKSGWDLRLLTENLLGEGSYEMYRQLSLYVHPSNIGRIKLVYNDNLQPDAIHDFGKAGELLVMSGNKAVAICELSNKVFDFNQEWKEKHEEIYKTPIFQQNYERFIQLHAQGETSIQALLEWINAYGSQYPEVGGVG